ncbi:MAG TPA: winged helix-turn-helix transcriptional regulator [Candidatus Limnocylindria bacterium]|nr:winged helix-turn-helix transcriptional regulator [Candidatus Limnocylindria bacterium]
MQTEKRSYDQFCAVAKALDVVGERWTLLLVRELMLGPQRFTDLLEGLPGIGTNLLTDRLKVLEQRGVIARRVLPPPAASAVYELTEVGRGLETVVLSLGRWGSQLLGPPKSEDAIRPGWFLISLRATFKPERVTKPREAFELRIDGKPFQVRIERKDVFVSQGPATDPDVIVTTDTPTLKSLVKGSLTPAAAVRSGVARVEGDRTGLQRFVDIFGWVGGRP